MDKVKGLIQEYEWAQNEIAKEIKKKAEDNQKEYERKLLIKITAILVGLYTSTKCWSTKNIKNIYRDNVQRAQRDVNAQYMAAKKKHHRILKK